MNGAYGLNIPQTLEEVCDPQRVALLVYDMQVGILSQIANPDKVTLQVLKVLTAARNACVRVFFRVTFATKRSHGHVSVPHRHGLAAQEFACTGESVAFARCCRISDH